MVIQFLYKNEGLRYEASLFIYKFPYTSSYPIFMKYTSEKKSIGWHHLIQKNDSSDGFCDLNFFFKKIYFKPMKKDTHFYAAMVVWCLN